MTQPLYIISSCAISAQHTCGNTPFLTPVVNRDDGTMYVIDPDYARYISPVAIRRMSRMLKRGITAGMRCLDEAGVKTPDAIIIGTSRGSVTDMEMFLHEMIDLGEQALNPTHFIQSTYNSVNGWLAMMTRCMGYNQTFVHRGFSLELSIMDAQMLMAESAAPKKILVGGFDELTPEYFTIRGKINYYKKEIPNSISLFSHYDTPGSIGGEGAQFFLLGNERANAACAIHSVQMLQKPGTEYLHSAINDMLVKNGLAKDDIDIFVSGMNGDSGTRHLVEPIISSFPAGTTIAAFKHLSGEYDTAAGFGLWLAHRSYTQPQLPEEVVYRRGSSTSVKNVLFCNITIGGDASLALLKAAAE